MRWAPYAPPVVLAGWALFTELAGDHLMPLWLLLLAVALVVMAATLGKRYSEDGRER